MQFIGEVEEESHGRAREQNITNQEGPKLLFDALGNFIGAASCSHSLENPNSRLRDRVAGRVRERAGRFHLV